MTSGVLSRKGSCEMGVMYKSLLLFFLNWLDAQLTLVWIKYGLATEGNVLMARLLTLGDASFLSTKIFLGAFAALILYRWSHLPLAQRGLHFVLGVYLLLMTLHLATPLHAL